MTHTNQPESDKHTCPECGGHGRYADNETCYLCGGTGFDPGPLVEPQQPDTELRQILERFYADKRNYKKHGNNKENAFSQAIMEIKDIIAAECQAARIDELERLDSGEIVVGTNTHVRFIPTTKFNRRIDALRSASRKDTE